MGMGMLVRVLAWGGESSMAYLNPRDDKWGLEGAYVAAGRGSI